MLRRLIVSVLGDLRLLEDAKRLDQRNFIIGLECFTQLDFPHGRRHDFVLVFVGEVVLFVFFLVCVVFFVVGRVVIVELV
jgi:hypothetical protein